jgi:hypothetical protein
MTTEVRPVPAGDEIVLAWRWLEDDEQSMYALERGRSARPGEGPGARRDSSVGPVIPCPRGLSWQ